MISDLPEIVTPVVHAALPAETLIVSPELALAMQVATLAWSGVVVQVGDDPVQAPCAEAQSSRRIGRARKSLLIFGIQSA